MIGQDRQAWIYRSQLAYSANELSQKHTVLASTVNEEEIRMARVVNNTSWGLFNSATYEPGLLQQRRATTDLS